MSKGEKMVHQNLWNKTKTIFMEKSKLKICIILNKKE